MAYEKVFRKNTVKIKNFYIFEQGGRLQTKICGVDSEQTAWRNFNYFGRKGLKKEDYLIKAE